MAGCLRHNIFSYGTLKCSTLYPVSSVSIFPLYLQYCTFECQSFQQFAFGCPMHKYFTQYVHQYTVFFRGGKSLYCAFGFWSLALLYFSWQTTHLLFLLAWGALSTIWNPTFCKRFSPWSGPRGDHTGFGRSKPTTRILHIFSAYWRNVIVRSLSFGRQYC